MSTFSRLLTDAVAAMFMLLAFASVREYRRGHGSASAWAATAFVMVGAIAALAFFPAEHELTTYRTFWYQALVKVVLAILVAFPYCLYRIAATFRPPSTVVRLTFDFVTWAVIVAILGAPRFPGPGEHRPSWVILYTIALIIQWTVTSIYAAVSLWRAGNGRSTAARYRMRLLGTGTAALTTTIYISALLPQTNPNKPNELIQLLQLAVGLVYFMGLSPPRALVDYWQRPEQDAARRAISSLMSAVTANEVAETLLPHLTVLIGAQSAALYNKDGSLFASHGELPPEGQHDIGESEPARGKLRAPLKSGGSIVVRSTTYSTLFGSDKIGLLQSFADLADLALARCASIAREREFISNAAHELRTPLTTMTGLAAMLAADRCAMDEEQISKCVEGLVRQGNRARELVNTLLDMAQIERGNVAFADDEIDLSNIVDDSLDFTPAPSDRQIVVEVPEGVKVRGDAERLEQVVVNLLTNAYRHGGKTINIQAHDERDGIVLSIADDGAGVPTDLIPKLFDPFSRGKTANGTGSGLGLAICRRIVEALGGTITYDPTPEWKSRFRVELRKAA